MFTRRKRSPLSKIVSALAIVGIAQSFLKRRRNARTSGFSKVIGSLGAAALALQTAVPKYGRRA